MIEIALSLALSITIVEAVKTTRPYKRWRALTKCQKAIEACIDEMYEHGASQPELHKYELQIRMPNCLKAYDAKFLGEYAADQFKDYGMVNTFCDVGAVLVPSSMPLHCYARWAVVSTVEEDKISQTKARYLAQGIKND